MIVLDASVVIAFLAADSHGPAARAFFAQTLEDDLRMNELTLAETLAGPARAGRTDVALAHLHRLRIGAVPLTDPIALARLRADTGLRMPDAVVLHCALAHHAALATFDRTLAARARELGVVVLPRPAQSGRGDLDVPAE